MALRQNIVWMGTAIGVAFTVSALSTGSPAHSRNIV
jgi:hypothetical protein